MADYIGKKVHHKAKYGNGIVVSQDEKGYVYIKFDNETEEKKFLAPSCFDTFLKLCDAPYVEKTTEERTQNDVTTKHYEEKKREEVKAHSNIGMMQLKQVTSKCNSVSVPKYSTLDSFFDEQEGLLIREISYLKKTGGKRTKIYDGQLVDYQSSRYVYSFESDSELNYPDNTQITLWLSSSSDGISGKIINCEDFPIIIEVLKDIGNTVSVCEFSSESWRLINYLIERMKILRENSSQIVRSLVCDGNKKIQHSNKIVTGQDNACKMSLSQPITFIWGPPGTGKTETLAKIAHEHLNKGYRVLMLSYSNVSVDGAINRVFQKDKKPAPGKIVRYGYPRDKELLQHEYLTSYNLVLKKRPDLFNERQMLIKLIKNLARTSNKYVETRKRLTEIRNLMNDEEKKAVRKADFVATTVSKAIADITIYGQKFDTVIFDEASMAYIPQIIISAGLAVKHFICMGDFAQLPPIVQSDSSSSLNADIFKFCGITDAVESGYAHEWLCMLDTQYRMHPDIAEFSSRTMYHGLLRSDESLYKKRQSIVNCEPFPEKALQLVDLSGMLSVCFKTSDQSRINVLSAFTAIGLAIKAAKKHDVGIITPYNAQSRLLHAFSRDVEQRSPDLSKITCATVHQFQGSEKDVIIYDVVDCYRMKYPGTLISSTTNNYSNRLYNVAVTRAKGKMISIVNADYMKTKKLSEKLIFRKMIDYLTVSKNYSSGNDLINKIGSDILSQYSQANGENAFIADLSEAKREIYIDIPSGTNASLEWIKKFTESIKEAKKRGIRLTIRSDNLSALSKEVRTYAIENKFITDPITIIDKQIIWYGIPVSNADFTAEGKTIPTRYKPILRFRGKYAAQSLYGLLEMSKKIDSSEATIDNESDETYNSFAAYVAGELHCKKCGASMKLRKSKKGKFFLSCKNYPKCDGSEYITTEMVDEYLYFKNPNGKRCPRDNKSLIAKKGPFGIYVCCCALAEHKYKLDEI